MPTLQSKSQAVIWDMDGVIADTAPYHFAAWEETFRDRGVVFTEADFRQSFGQKNENIVRQVLGDAVPAEEMRRISLKKEATYRRRIRRNLKPLPGAIALMKALSARHWRMALASSTPLKNVQLVIKGLGIQRYFPVIVSAEDVTEGKPSPQVFLLAAQRLAVRPEDCVVIEDAIVGVTAARRAGMRCIAVTNTHPEARLTEADLVVDTLERITADDLARLINSER